MDAIRRTANGYRIYIESIEPHVIKGWAKRKYSNKPLKLQVVIDESVVAAALVSDIYRKDLAEKNIGDGRFGFSIEIPQGFRRKINNIIKFIDKDNGKILYASQINLAPPRGNIEARDGNYLIGWAHGVSQIDIYIDETLIVSSAAPNFMRDDVNHNFGGSSPCGFKIDISNTFLPPNASVSIKNSLDGALIFSSAIAEVPVMNYADQGRMPLTATAENSALHYYSQYASYLSFFDEVYYLLNNPDVARLGILPFKHFMDHGWKEGRNPSAAFDLIWYTQTYLDSDWSVNALQHHASAGAAAGNATRPRQPVTFNPAFRYQETKQGIRRVCLFAGYDANGLMDPVAVEAITEIARHADVFYLADCDMAQSELDKIAHLVKGAWAGRHGRYDFGSWSKLARDLVGWDVIESYDELILMNDSSFLMHPFDAVFARMDARACDWWGLLAAKGIASTIATQALKGETPIEEIKLRHLTAFENEPVYDFLLGSYFLVCRAPVIRDQGFRAALNNVQEERNKLLVIRKYEIGITRYLLSKGFAFDTFIDRVYPEQAIYTEKAFSLLSEGFPLLKRYHLIENHYGIEDLWRWPDLLREAGITKDLSIYADNLRRVANSRKLSSSMDILSPGLKKGVPSERLVEIDGTTPKYDDWWCFPVCAFSNLLNDNIRALFEEIKDDPSIKKIVLTRSKSIDLEGTNVKVLLLDSQEGQFYLTRSRHIFLKHSVHSNLAGANLSGELHDFHNLWHGIPLKRIGYASRDQQAHLDALETQNRLLRSVICASKVDQLAMAAAYWPLTVNDIWLTGLPRHDLILKDENLLPLEMRTQLRKLRDTLGGRKLIIFAPTFKNDQNGGYYSFGETEIARVTDFLMANGYVLGVREHMADKSRQYSSQLKGECYISLSEDKYPVVEVLMREASALVTDYSSIFIDFLITGRPVVSFAYDYDRYVNEERGLFYDLDWCFPGTIAKDFDALMEALQAVVTGMDERARERYAHRRRLFIEHLDDGNAARVAERVKRLEAREVTLLDIEQRSYAAQSPKRAVWVFEADDRRSAQYRVFALCAELSRRGWSNKIVSTAELAFEDLTTAAVVVLSRVAADDRMLDMIEAVRRAGCLVVVDIDDLTIDPADLRETQEYRSSPTARERLRAAAYGQQRLMEVASVVTVSTGHMKEHVEKSGIPVRVVPPALASIGGMPPRPQQRPPRAIRICYVPEAQAHAEDFAQLAGVRERVLEAHPDAEFHIAGNVSADERENEALLAGWIRHPASGPSRSSAFFQSMDVNLAPRAPAGINRRKQALPFLEAGAAGVPTIASPTESFVSLIDDGRNGFLAATPDEWVSAIACLCADPDSPSRIGAEARNTATRSFRPQHAAEVFSRLCSELEPMRAAATARLEGEPVEPA